MQGYTNIVLLKGIITTPIKVHHSVLNGTEQDWCTFSVAIKEDYSETPKYFNCIAYTDKFEYINTHCKRNDRVFVRGRLDQYTDKRKVIWTNIIVSDIDVLFRDKRKKSLETLETEVEQALGEIGEDYTFE